MRNHVKGHLPNYLFNKPKALPESDRSSSSKEIVPEEAKKRKVVQDRLECIKMYRELGFNLKESMALCDS